jgi:hypothetical protein
MKVSNWNDKKFYLLFTSGAPKKGLILNFVAILQTMFTINYFGSKKKIIKIMGSCGNGKRNIVNNRERALAKIAKKGKKIFS